MIAVFQKNSGRMGPRLRRARIALLFLAVLLEVACSEQYRPVVQPILPPPPNPGAVHYIISLTTNGSDVLAGGACSPSGLLPPCVSNPGSADLIDVSGDSYTGSFNTGVAPIHAAVTMNGNKVYTANFREDTVSVSNISNPTAVNTISLPAGSQPVFVHTTEMGNMYVANYGNNTVSQINTASDVVTGSVVVGAQPVALAEMPNAQKVYAVNQGAGTVTSINVLGFTVSSTIPLPGGAVPIWAVARTDNAKVYVLDNNGTIYEIDTLTESVAAVPIIDSSNTSLGAGANFMSFDPVAQRLYVTNPATGRVAILNTATDPNPVPQVLKVIDLAQGANPPCPGGCSPASVTGIGDGSRAYVASYQLASCLDFLMHPFPCMNTQVEVIATGNNTISKVIPISTGVPLDLTNPADCGPSAGPPAAAPWTPVTARFRVFTTASGGGSISNFKVYVSQCDAGSVAVIDTFADSLSSNPHPADTYTAALSTPLSSFPAQRTGISAAAVSNGMTTYNYVLNSGPGLQVGMKVLITGMSNTGNNGYFVISSLATGAFTVANAGGVTAPSQSGTGLVVPLQNPVFLVAGP
jgi:YVTN family beta-propeller protein